MIKHTHEDRRCGRVNGGILFVEDLPDGPLIPEFVPPAFPQYPLSNVSALHTELAITPDAMTVWRHDLYVELICQALLQSNSLMADAAWLPVRSWE
eukprot:CAMPEP_0181139852 /NCGR_PEP_ID=MMETSP1071-20121207/34999_1 /TAXON_ID=35127 /ORGANISM="Thalassiosira sp., Strain NH16" /LENGTH=95 /DNA_ID=CAMNT_0023226779 /DNA_START=155 /DNA_END=444 /DNA_ORIENTATION=+